MIGHKKWINYSCGCACGLFYLSFRMININSICLFVKCTTRWWSVHFSSDFGETRINAKWVEKRSDQLSSDFYRIFLSDFLARFVNPIIIGLFCPFFDGFFLWFICWIYLFDLLNEFFYRIIIRFILRIYLTDLFVGFISWIFSMNLQIIVLSDYY